MSDSQNCPSSEGGHRWKFFRAGGVDQVALDTSADLAALKQLDQKLWVVLSCPTRGLEFDSKTLDLVDTDRDGHIRVPEILAAVDCVVKALKDPMEISRRSDALPLSSIDTGTEEGRRLAASARQILASLGKADDTAISISDTTDTAAIFAKTRFNGDGIVPPGSVDDEASKAVIADIIACLGGETDRSGVPGVTQAKVDQFFQELQAFADWWKKAEENAAEMLPLGEATPAAYAALTAVRRKVDDYFTRCRLAAFDSHATEALNRTEAEYRAAGAKEMSAAAVEAADFPLARVEPGRALPLVEGVNPAWADALSKMRSEVVKPLLPRHGDTLTPEEWRAILARFAPYESWLATKSGAPVEKLGIARVREILAGKTRETLTAAIAQDQALEAEMNEIVAVDRLVRYYRDLYELLCNFVSFREFYSGRRKAVFQAGTLYLDGRSCDLCLKVADAGKHAELAALSKIFLAYCDCTRKGSAEKMTIAAAFTGGDSTHLMVGRNGIFYDRTGADWDATIVRMIEHPISIREAIILPYTRMGRMIGEQIQKFTAARQKAAEERALARVTQAGTAATPAPAAQQQGGGIGQTVGILAAIGLAVGAIGTAIATLVTGFLGLKWWQMPLSILGIFVLISGFSVLLAVLKLRQRNLGPMLDANGWAINGRAKINIPFGGALTKVARLPKGSVRMLKDPYAGSAKKVKFWSIVVLVTLIILIYELLMIAGIVYWPVGSFGIGLG